ncbi:MAG: YihY family inner membrane protein [Rhodobacteraceae bacterium]|nr:YihY family inner membrane protein [Paracoccaceae bacterium]
MTSERKDLTRLPNSGRLSSTVNYVLFTLRRFYEDGMMQSVGALTYSTLLALVPLLVIAFAIFSAFPAFDTVQDRLQALVYENILPETGRDLQVYLDRFTSNASELTAVGVVALIISAILLLSTIEATLNRIWRVERQRPLLTRLLVFWTLLTLGPLLLGASFTASSDSLVWLEQWTGEATGGAAFPRWLRMVFAAAVQAAVFTSIFRLVPARPVRLLDAAIGGAIGGIGFELLKWGFQAVMASGSTYSTIYGAVAAVPIFLVWIYACWTVIILGAVFAASLSDWRRDRKIVHSENIGPSHCLAAAVSVLAMLARQARQGGGPVDHERLAELIPLSVRDRLTEHLHRHGYIVETTQGKIALARDLGQTTLADLARDLDLALGTSGDAPLVPGALARHLARLSQAEDDILGRPLAELTSEPAEADRAAATAVKLSPTA